MLAYERGAWTDEHLNASASKDRFELPEVEGGHARWRWVEGSEWHVEGEKDGEDAWMYYDNKWHDGRRGKDGWGRYTRRRKWCRDAELVEVTPSTDITPSPTPRADVSGANDNVNPPTTPSTAAPPSDINSASDFPPDYSSQADGGDGSTTAIDDGSVSSSQQRKQRGWFRRRNTGGSRGWDAGSQYSGVGSSSSVNLSGPDDHEDRHVPFSQQDVEREWGLGEDARMGFG
ncbi:hypothetical protein LTS18_003662 [Coniosporium uncinatum]|uniref:Uncharacterized protein n=1 Tax=Coniosporium uncinatum TaxID=93489 RepID=A0ACC3DTN6_9PEZI|nr:hypothetical protein LTS18_003662 [Coniosporium uncinatum]